MSERGAARPLLLEIGCEEIPARMIRGAEGDLGRGLVRLLDQAGLSHGAVHSWGGSRRLAVRVDAVPPHQADREETVLGPPAAVAYDAEGELTRAGLGFARKQGVDPAELTTVETERGPYLGLHRHVAGKSLEHLLAEGLPGVVQAISFPKTMRWGDGSMRWVRPVHWVLALHGELPLRVRLFGVESSTYSFGHRFLGPARVEVEHPDSYAAALARAFVVVDPHERRRRLSAELERAAGELGGRVVEDAELLEEVVELVEWPAVVAGRFAEHYLELPRELLVTTLRHHQKCFSVQAADGALLAAFLAVANTEQDPAGHVRRGNEWVVGGRLEDARFFWNEDRRRPLAERTAQLESVVFHARGGSYADKAGRMERIAAGLGELLGLALQEVEHCRTAARLAKNDLVTGTVGEFPELQGQVGGLMLRAEGAAPAVADGVYEHYRPVGSEDPTPETKTGRVVAVADKLDSIACLFAGGERPSGSKDPLGLRRAGNGIVRILLDAGWPLTLQDLVAVSGYVDGVGEFLRERLTAVLRDAGFTIKEIFAVMRPRVAQGEADSWPLGDIRARLEAIKRVRGRDDFRQLVKLTERVDNILTKSQDTLRAIVANTDGAYEDPQETARRLAQMIERRAETMESNSQQKRYDANVEILSEFIDPVEQFFVDCLVIDESNPAATRSRFELLTRLNKLLTRYFDIRELAGEAERSE